MNKIEKAVLFATKAHAGTCRKGTDRPYILHPLEAMAIVMKFTDDQDVLAAAVLHDTVEDTSVSIEHIEKEFGSRVAALVDSVTENKRKDHPAETTWKERKQETIAAIAGGIAEAYYGVPEEFSNQARAYLDKGLLSIVDAFAAWSRMRSRETGSTFSLASSPMPC